MDKVNPNPPVKSFTYPADELRTPVNVLAPDQRNFYFGVTSTEHLYADIAKYSLNHFVPNDIKVQFDTARNLFLHSFYVYRFYVVAQSLALTTLELAIRECIGDEKLAVFKGELKASGVHLSKGLKLCLEYLAKYQLIKNEDFPTWQNRNRIAAEEAYRDKIFQLMDEQKLNECQFNENEIDEHAFDIEWDYIQVLCETLPKIRNNQAHGSTILHNKVLLSFENISIIINKMYERTASDKK